MRYSDRFDCWSHGAGAPHQRVVPVDARTFKPDSTGLLKMKNISAGQAFAVTIENEGGSATPALETLQVIGNVPV